MLPTADESQPVPPQPVEPLPEKIGRYRILERLGAGGMGTVYKAHDPQLDRVVAIKLPRFDGPQDNVAIRIQRFQREARVAAQIWHPHICPIYDVGEHEGQPYVVMAYVEGRSLAKSLTDHRRCDDTCEAVALIRQILDGLEAVHAHGIIHRDLKPGNIMIDKSGRAVLTDFGLARPENDAEHLTSEGVVVGTPAYMAPEQAAGQSERIGPWTDLYSVGVVLYRMLTGRLPFEGPPLVVLNRIVHEAIPPPSSLRTDLNLALEAILLKAMVKEPSERYQSARMFADALSCWLQSICGKAASQAAAMANEPRSPDQPTANHSRTITRPKSHASATAFPSKGTIFLVTFWVMLWVVIFFVEDQGFKYVILLVGVLSGWFLLSFLRWRRGLPKALLKAAAIGQSDKVSELISTGVAANVKDEMGENALMKAAENGHSAIVKILLVKGARVNEKNRFGQTALTMAVARGHGDIVELLKQAGAKE